MTATDQLRTAIRDLEAKAKELELDKKLATFADQADHYLRVAARRAGDFAAENRERVEATLDKAGSKVDEKTDGKYHSYVGKVRAGVLTGVDWVAEQRETPASTDAGATADAGGTASGTSTDSRHDDDSTRRGGCDDLPRGGRRRRRAARHGGLRRLGRRQRHPARHARCRAGGPHRPEVTLR